MNAEGDVLYSPLLSLHCEQLRSLHFDCFPLQYDDNFYTSVEQGTYNNIPLFSSACFSYTPTTKALKTMKKEIQRCQKTSSYETVATDLSTHTKIDLANTANAEEEKLNTPITREKSSSHTSNHPDNDTCIQVTDIDASSLNKEKEVKLSRTIQEEINEGKSVQNSVINIVDQKDNDAKSSNVKREIQQQNTEAISLPRLIQSEKQQGTADTQRKTFIKEPDLQSKNGRLIGCALAQICDRMQGETAIGLLSLASREVGGYINCCYLLTMAVNPLWRRRGIATTLLKDCIDYANADETCGAVYLHVITYNLAAVKFYEQNGFQRMKTCKEFYLIENKLYDAYVYVKYLKNASPAEEFRFSLRPSDTTTERMTNGNNQAGRETEKTLWRTVVESISKFFSYLLRSSN